MIVVIKYLYESALDDINTTRILIRRVDGGFFERWDHQKIDWIKDNELARINIGEMIVDDCTEEEANQIIERFKHEHND